MRLFGLIGFPLSHSFSEQYFRKKFLDENISDADYRLFPLEQINTLIQLVTQNKALLGFNVTIPYKKKIFPLLDEIDEVASDIGAVNTVVISRYNHDTFSLKGFNTDAPAFAETLLPLLKQHHTSALILGTGGAAKAVEYALKTLNIPYMFASRNPSSTNIINYNDVTSKTIINHTIIINTTPLGMYPDIENCPPLPYQHIGSNHLLYDLVYNPELTVFLKNGLMQKASVQNGLPMLMLQAEKSWNIWNKEI